MTIDPKTTAVVLIEFQNDFTSDGGVLHGAVSDVMEKTDMLAGSDRPSGSSIVSDAREVSSGE